MKDQARVLDANALESSRQAYPFLSDPVGYERIVEGFLAAVPSTAVEALNSLSHDEILDAIDHATSIKDGILAIDVAAFREALSQAKPVAALAWCEEACTTIEALEGELREAKAWRQEIERLSANWMKYTGQAYCYVGIRDYAAVKEQADSLTRELSSERARTAELEAANEAGIPIEEPHRQRFKSGVRAAIEWLHSRAKYDMNDPHAKAILNTAAYNLGNALARNEVKLESRSALVNTTPSTTTVSSMDGEE